MKQTPIKQVDSIEEAIRTVLIDDTYCQIEWYALGKTKEELNNYLGGIDYQKLGVVVSARFNKPFVGKVTFMPESWIVRDSDRHGSTESHQ